MKKNTSLIMGILVISLAVAMSGYAYFSAKINIGSNINTNITTSSVKPVFTANPGNELNLNINIETLTTANIGNVVNNTANINVTLDGKGNSGTISCTYDIVFVWDGDEYKATTELPAKNDNQEAIEEVSDQVETPQEDNKEYKFELSLQGSNGESQPKLAETNLDALSWNGGDKKRATVVKGATITTNGSSATSNWTFTLSFYTLPTEQNMLLKKEYKGHLEVTNVVC